LEKETKKNEWENYGDVTPQAGGRYLKKSGNNSYDVVEVKYYYDEEKYLIDKYYIDLDNINDSWIEKKDVMSFIGMTEKEFDPIWFLLGAVDYYGSINFGHYDNTLYTEVELLTELKSMGIE